MTYPLELRKRVIAKIDARLTQKETASQLAVSRSWVNKIWHCHQAHGLLFPPRKTMGRPPKLDEEARRQLKAWVDEDPDQTQRQLAERMTRHLGCSITDLNILYALRALGYTYKKNRRARRTQTT